MRGRAAYERLKRSAELGDADALERVEREARRRGDHAGWLAATLKQTPTDGRWRDLVHCVETLLASGESLDLDLVEQALDARWPDALRVAPPTWWARAAEGFAGWRIVRALDVSRHMLGNPGLIALSANPALARITVLDLALNRVSGRGLRAFADSEYVTGLQSLDLSAGQRMDRHHYLERITDNGAAILASSTQLTSLRVLKLRCNSVLSDGLAAIASSPTFTRLEHLDIAYQSQPGPRPFLDDPGFTELAASHTLTRLRHLDAAGNAMTSSSFRALLQSAVGRHLTWLDLTWNRLGDDALHALVELAPDTALETLRLNNAFIRDTRALRRWPAQESALRHLHLDDNRITDDGLEHLSESPLLAQLETLSLRRNNLTHAPHVEALCRAAPRLQTLDLGVNHLEALALDHPTLERLDVSSNPLRALGGTLPALTHLDATGNALDPAASTALLENALESAIHTLDMSGQVASSAFEEAPRDVALREAHLNNVDLDPEGCAALAHSSLSGVLELLDVSHNPIGDSGLRALCEHTVFPALTTLTLHDCDIHTLDGLTHASMPALRALSLSANPIQSLDALTQSPLLRQLQRLELSGCDALDEASVVRLLQSPNACNLEHITLERCELGEATVVALAESPSMRRLRSLRFHGNTVNDVGARALATSPHLTLLDELEIHWGHMTEAGVEAIDASTTLPLPAQSRLTRED